MGMAMNSGPSSIRRSRPPVCCASFLTINKPAIVKINATRYLNQTSHVNPAGQTSAKEKSEKRSAMFTSSSLDRGCNRFHQKRTIQSKSGPIYATATQAWWGCYVSYGYALLCLLTGPMTKIVLPDGSSKSKVRAPHSSFCGARRTGTFALQS